MTLVASFFTWPFIKSLIMIPMSNKRFLLAVMAISLENTAKNLSEQVAPPCLENWALLSYVKYEIHDTCQHEVVKFRPCTSCVVHLLCKMD